MEPVVEEAPVAAPIVLPVAVVTPEPDLITKVSQFKKPVAAPRPEGSFDAKDIDKITDPVAREYVERLQKSLVGDYTKKTQAIAEEKKRLEETKRWTPERIQQELLNNQEFLSAAQQIQATQNPPNSGLTDEQFSSLTDKEKAEIASLKSELTSLKQNNVQATIRAEITQTDAQLRSKFADYNPVEIDRATQELAGMTLSGIREYVYKAQFHDEHVKAAYEMGKEDGRGITQNKIGGMSQEGMASTSNDVAPIKNKGESDQAFFVRIAKARLEQSRRK